MGKEKKNNENEQTQSKYYKPSESDQKVIKYAYDSIRDMLEIKNKTWPEFNNRTLKTFIDDGEKRLNAYVLPKESYSPAKEDWQSNVPLPSIRNQ